MKKFSIILATLILLATGATAALAEVTVSGSAAVSVNSMYLWRGFDLSPDSDFVVQPAVNLSAAGFTLGYWSNYDEDSSRWNETDLTLDYTFAPTELVSVSVGNIYYILKGLEDTNELYVKVVGNVLLSPTFTAYYDWDEADETGLFFTAAISKGFDLTDGVALNLGALVSYNAESDFSVGNYSGFHNGELSAGIAWSAAENLVVTPAVIYSMPLSDDAEDVSGIDDKMLAGVTVAYSF